MRKFLFFVSLTALLFANSCTNNGPSTSSDLNGCFYFEAESAGASISMEKVISGVYDGPEINPSLEYTTDKSNWAPFLPGQTVVTLQNSGDRVYIRAKNPNDRFFAFDSVYNYTYCRFASTGRVKVAGNIMFLLDGSGSKTDLDLETNVAAFNSLFNNMESLTDASALLLPASTSEYCYNSMFYHCISLTAPPALPSSKLNSHCYNDMFDSCISMTTAPLLPATQLTFRCYGSMFSNCISLKEAPQLPATALDTSCYQSMFFNCTSLRKVDVSFADWDTTKYPTYKWLKGVSESGTFICPQGLDTSIRKSSRIPNGWTIKTK